MQKARYKVKYRVQLKKDNNVLFFDTIEVSQLGGYLANHQAALGDLASLNLTINKKRTSWLKYLFTEHWALASALNIKLYSLTYCLENIPDPERNNETIGVYSLTQEAEKNILDAYHATNDSKPDFFSIEIYRV